MDAAMERARAVFRCAKAVNRVWQDRGSAVRVSGAFLAECDDVAFEGARKPGTAARNPVLTFGGTEAGFAERVLDFVRFGPEACDGATAESLMGSLCDGAVSFPPPEADPERGDCLRYPCATFWGCCCGGASRCCDAIGTHGPDVFTAGFVIMCLFGVLFGLSYAAALPWMPAHTEERCGNRWVPGCAPYNETVHDMTWRSMGIGFGVTLGCAAAVSACTVLCCSLYACEDARKRRAIGDV